jgi:hypothetical protein
MGMPADEDVDVHLARDGRKRVEVAGRYALSWVLNAKSQIRQLTCVPDARARLLS